MTRQTKWRIDYPRPVILEVPFAARRHLTGLILSAGVHLDLEQAERVADIILADEQHRPDPADYLTAPDAHYADSLWRAEQILAGHHDPGARRAASPAAAHPSMPLPVVIAPPPSGPPPKPWPPPCSTIVEGS